MSDQGVKVDVTRARVKVSRLKDLPQLTRKKLAAWGALAVQVAKRNASGGIVGKYRGGRRTGQLKRNIAMKAVEFGAGDAGILVGTGPQVGTNETKYASILEHGGTIRPKKKKFLAIPLPGVKGVPANYPDIFPITSKKGTHLLVAAKWRRVRGGMNSKRTGDLIPLFVLKKEVTIPPFHWLQGTIDTMLPELHRQLAPQVLVDELLGGFTAD